jgi:hypothetical protein
MYFFLLRVWRMPHPYHPPIILFDEEYESWPPSLHSFYSILLRLACLAQIFSIETQCRTPSASLPGFVWIKIKFINKIQYRTQYCILLALRNKSSEPVFFTSNTNTLVIVAIFYVFSWFPIWFSV